MITRDRMGQPYKAHEMLLGDRMGVSHETRGLYVGCEWGWRCVLRR